MALENVPVAKEVLILSLNGLEYSDFQSFRILVGMLFRPTPLFTFILSIQTSVSSGVVGVRNIPFSFMDPKYDRYVFLDFTIFLLLSIPAILVK